MRRAYGGLSILLLIPLLLAARPQGTIQDTPNIAGHNAAGTHLEGAWALSLEPSQGSFDFDSNFVGKRVLMFKSTGTDVQVTDPRTKSTWAGKASDNAKFSFSLPVKTDSSGNAKSALFIGSISGNTISGRAKFGDIDVGWKAVKLPSAWECSNHKNPSHVATSEDEMRSLTNEYMCTGWHKLK